MAYDPATAKCDEEIYKNGKPVFLTSMPSRVMEAWVEMVREDMKKAPNPAKIDWHYVGGRAVILVVGDFWTAYRAIRRMLPEHDLMQKVTQNEDLYQSSYRVLYRENGAGDND